MPWTNTNLETLEETFVASIRQITPRHQRATDDGWKPYLRERPPSIGVRWFRLEWDTIGYTPGGFIGDRLVDTSVTLSVIVDYGSMPEAVAKRVIEDDHYQLRDVLNLLKATTEGLIWVEAIDWEETAESKPDQMQAIHQYLVRYMQRRA